MKVPSDKTLLSVMPIEYIVDGQPGISDPMGMNGVRLEARTHLVYCSQNTKNNISKCVEEINSLKINKYFFNQLGAAECTLTKDQKELGICLIDIGAGTTDLTVYRGVLYVSQRSCQMLVTTLQNQLPSILKYHLTKPRR